MFARILLNEFETKWEERGVETMKAAWGGSFVEECPSTKVMKSVIQGKNEGRGEPGVQGTKEDPQVLTIEVGEEVQKEVTVEIDLVEPADLAVEVLEDSATGEFDLCFSFRGAVEC